ncbi:hypothetical protein Pcinc_003473 [Petrolisthes cinctipes]|uniref:PHD-type domain-containing protein n=1 Tax=Petrolisthes cinctipes TaxID=88211 RepID=A0AAE1GH90_PETCI|nr:hypothetical protein Pcinc_003473 [Petrolisthes cinctipes]
MEDKRGKETCMVCERRVSSDEEGLQCDGCQGWYHRECEEMDKNLYLQIGKHKAVKSDEVVGASTKRSYELPREISFTSDSLLGGKFLTVRFPTQTALSHHEQPSRMKVEFNNTAVRDLASRQARNNASPLPLQSPELTRLHTA